MKRKRSFDEASFARFLKEHFDKLNESWQPDDSVWAACCNAVGFENLPKHRKLMCIRWQNNYSGIRHQIIKEKSEEQSAPEPLDDSSLGEHASSLNSKSEIEKMMAPSFAMLQCSNCSVFFIFSSRTYEECPLIDYLCSHCSLSSSDYQKRTKAAKTTLTSTTDCSASRIGNQNKKMKTDHGYCEENKKAMVVNVDNFVNEVTIETSHSPVKAASGIQNKKDSEVNKNVKNEHVIYISDLDKLKKLPSEATDSLDNIEGDQDEICRYQFILGNNHWKQINNCKGNDFNLTCGKIFSKYFSQFELGCSLTYRHCQINRENSWKQKNVFIKVIGVCKHDFCSKYIFTIDTPPQQDENIVVNISQIGPICHNINFDHVNSTTKSTSSIVSVEEPHKFQNSNQYENSEIRVREGSNLMPVEYVQNYYTDEPHIDDRSCDKISDAENSSSCSDEEEMPGFEENEMINFSAFDYSSHNQFTLDYKDWEKMMPSFDEQKLKIGWEKIFADYFHQFELGCFLEFAYCKLRKPFSMDNSVYLNTFAKCVFPNCSTFIFQITHKPIKGEIVIVDVFQQGCVSHKTDDTASEFNSPSKIAANENEEVYYSVDNLPEDHKEPLDLDVSQVVTIETSHSDCKADIKSERASSDANSDDDSFDIENQLLPYELNSEGKILQSVIHKFEIKYEDWIKMKPLKHCKTLQPGWTDIFFQYFANLNLGCILAFSYCYANKRKKGTNYLRIKSICKYTGCCKYYFHMKKEPKPGKPGKVNAIQVGAIEHRDGEVRARFIRGKYRKEVAKQLQNTSAFDFYNENRSRLAESGYDSNRKKSLHVLRNIKIKKKKESITATSSEMEGGNSFDNFANKIEGSSIQLL